jgi:exo-1,4-beta-D-glucosaminidase
MSDSSDQIDRRTFLGVLGAAALVTAVGCKENQSGGEAQVAAPAAERERILLSTDWQIQASNQTADKGEAISKPGYSGSGWVGVSVPSTVMAGLVAAGQFPDLYFGDNLKKVRKQPFRTSWWYRRELEILAPAAGKQIWLYFKGINYKANIWINGQKIAGQDQVAGTYRDFEFNITSAVKPGGANALAVEVTPPIKSDLCITFVDWAPAAPDANMGLWQDVELRFSGPVAIRWPHILTDLELPGMGKAKLTVVADLVNATGQAQQVSLAGAIGDVQFEKEFDLDANETRTVWFEPGEFPQLAINQPRVWWPWQLGKQEMYSLELTARVLEGVSDRSKTSFGIRKMTKRTTPDGHALFSVNGVDTLVLGGGYAPDLLQRRVMADRPTWQEDHLRYVKDMNLNAVRLEGKLEDDAFYDLCDRQGILVLAGWCCCSAWERWKDWTEEHHAIAEASLRYQIRRARTHPAILVWLNGSDMHPPAAVERKYLEIEKQLYWPNPTLSSAGSSESQITGPSTVKMNGPYKWEPPIYWTADKTNGGAWGFNTEVGPGAVPPPLESLEEMLPADHRWPIDEVWNFHCCGGEFKTFNDFLQALEARFGKPKGIADFAWKSQAQAYETIKAMYEAFRANKFDATGEIQWMLNNAWPSMYWHLYDYYLRPGGAYFATKVGCRPVHILYRYDNHAIMVANDTLQDASGLTATVQVYGLDAMSVVHQHVTPCTAAANSSTVIYTIPELDGISTTYFLRLSLADANGNMVSINSYWLSLKPDVLDFDSSTWNNTPCTAFADYTALDSLGPVNLETEDFGIELRGAQQRATYSVRNTSNTVAVMVRLKLLAGDKEVLPIRWEDNYFMLLPGEKRQVTAEYFVRDLPEGAVVVNVDCFNNGRA